ncbi:MAG: hypothetical protein R3C19_11870 [Planctomycetaceae bacterium]
MASLALSLAPGSASGQEFPADERQPLLQISVRTSLLDQLLSRTIVKPGDVTTRILDASVRGSRTTETVIHVRGQSCPDMAQVDLVACGTVSSSTVSVAPGARVASAGSHTYEIIKPVYFGDGKLLTRPGHGSLQARNMTQSVNSVVSGVPLVGPLGDQIAWRETLRRNPAVEAVIVRQVADEVLPEVNRNVDAELAAVNQSWQFATAQLKALLPGGSLQWQSSSTVESVTIALIDVATHGIGGSDGFSTFERSDNFTFDASSGASSAEQDSITDTSDYGVLRVPSASEPAASDDASEDVSGGSFPDGPVNDERSSTEYRTLTPGPEPEEDLVLTLSEDFLNRLLDVPALRGLVLSDAALQRLSEKVSGTNTGGSPDPLWSFSPASLLAYRDLQPTIFSVQLADSRPVQVELRDGRLTLVLTFRVVPKSANASDPVRLRIPLQGVNGGSGEWAIRIEPASVSPTVDGAQAAMWSQLVQTQAEQILRNVPAVTLPRRMDFSSVISNLPMLDVYRIQSHGGQLRASLRRSN